jgi:hypothetical protein
VPIGYLVTVALAGFCTVFALAPPRPRRSSPANRSYWFGFLLNELPFVGFYWLLASTLLALGQRDIASTVGWVAFALAVLTSLGLAVVAWRGLRARPAVDHALSDGLGASWRTHIDAETALRLRRRLPWGRILFAPFFVRRRDVERVANISYGDAGKENLLDVYRSRSHPSRGPTLVYLHGGTFRSGRKDKEARPLIYRLASQGWVCISANYRLSPAATFPDHLIDVKKVIAWIREHGQEYGADPTVVFVAGSLRAAIGPDGRSRPTTLPFSPASRRRTPRFPQPSRCTATTAPSTASDNRPHLWTTSTQRRHRSSWPTATATRW